MHCPRLQSVVRPPSLTSVPAGTPMAQVLPVPCGLVVAAHWGCRIEGEAAANAAGAIHSTVMCECGPTMKHLIKYVKDDLPDPGDDSFDDFMCATSVAAGTWAIRSAYVGGAMILMGGVPSAASFFRGGAYRRIFHVRRISVLWQMSH